MSVSEVEIVDHHFQRLYKLGAHKVGVTSLPPLGCLPASITLFGSGENVCVSRLNSDSQHYNTRLQATVNSLAKSLPRLKIVVFDIYTTLYSFVQHPSDNGNSAFCISGNCVCYVLIVLGILWF